MAARVLGVKRVVHVSREEAEALIIDCTEQPIQRPSRKQRRWYSGKKKRHTIKTEIVITENGQIVSISKPAPGRVHDLEIRPLHPFVEDDNRKKIPIRTGCSRFMPASIAGKWWDGRVGEVCSATLTCGS